MKSQKDEDMSQAGVAKLRNLIKFYLDQEQTGSAQFWAGQLVALTNWEPADAHVYAHTLFRDSQWLRAAHIIKEQQLHKVSLESCHLGAKALYRAKEFDDALELLESRKALYTSIINQVPYLICFAPRWATVESKFDQLSSSKDSEEEADLRRTVGSIYLLRGQILENLDNRGLAAEAFKDALQIDITCSEAFNALSQHHILSAEGEKQMLQALPSHSYKDDLTPLIQFLYTSKLKKYDKPKDECAHTSMKAYTNSHEFMVQMAERYFYNCDYNSCYKITTNVLKQDPYHSECLPIHISCLVELNNSNDLFQIAHKLVELYPERALAWFAVGTYYYLVGKQELARRYLSKATQLDRVFGPAWLAYGHSFAVDNEHDQAMPAYFKACQLMKGCHLPLLYIGVEYGLTNNVKLAEQFLHQATQIAPEDPFILHQLGVVSFQDKRYRTAEQYFEHALKQIQDHSEAILSPKWEPLLNNLGHTYRKLGKLDEALDYHQQALILKPLSASTYSAVGYVHALKGDLIEASEAFHKALGIRRDDSFSTAMLNYVIENLTSSSLTLADSDMKMTLPSIL